MFSNNLSFEKSYSSICFPAHYLRAPIIQDERTLKEFLRESPADLLTRPKNDDSLVGRVRTFLRESERNIKVCDEFPSFARVAENMRFTPQTLRRRLRNEGFTYQEIKDQFRRDKAISYLSRPEISLDEVAYQLGFSESSAFHRAFKKWTGTTPGAYRNQKRIGHMP
jgi:AraC-like DNA-binding protein